MILACIDGGILDVLVISGIIAGIAKVRDWWKTSKYSR